MEFGRCMERAVTAGDKPGAAHYLAPDIAYTVGARASLHGIDAVMHAVAAQSRVVRWDGHDFRQAWIGGDSVVVEVISHFTRIADGRRISFPCADIYRFTGGRISDWRVFADMSPFEAS